MLQFFSERFCRDLFFRTLLVRTNLRFGLSLHDLPLPCSLWLVLRTDSLVLCRGFCTHLFAAGLKLSGSFYPGLFLERI